VSPSSGYRINLKNYTQVERLYFLRFLTLKMEEMLVCSSEVPIKFYKVTKRQVPKDSTLHGYRCENLESAIKVTLSLYLTH
jgi:predicted DNA-binding ribbon-helix-helix protein